MLVLTRSKNETIEIGKKGDVLDGPILVTPVEIRGAKIRLGIEAPINIPVYRGEVADALRAEAAAVSTSDESTNAA